MPILRTSTEWHIGDLQLFSCNMIVNDWDLLTAVCKDIYIYRYCMFFCPSRLHPIFQSNCALMLF